MEPKEIKIEAASFIKFIEALSKFIDGLAGSGEPLSFALANNVSLATSRTGESLVCFKPSNGLASFLAAIFTCNFGGQFVIASHDNSSNLVVEVNSTAVLAANMTDETPP